jgi:hypothetical protein
MSRGLIRVAPGYFNVQQVFLFKKANNKSQAPPGFSFALSNACVKFVELIVKTRLLSASKKPLIESGF